MWTLLSAALLVALASSDPSDGPLASLSELDANDECAAGASSHCALHALQTHGLKLKGREEKGSEWQDRETYFEQQGVGANANASDAVSAFGQTSKQYHDSLEDSSLFSRRRRTVGPTGCQIDTGGRCRLFGCKSFRNSKCIGGKCLCRANLCATEQGICQIPPSTLTAKVAEIDRAHPFFPRPDNAIDTAICLSGGGARAAAQTVGVLRALEHLKLMPSVDAVSSVSGSLFVAIPYMFANEKKYKGSRSPGEPLLGFSPDPRKLKLSALDYSTSPIGETFADGWGGTWGTVKAALTKMLPTILKDSSTSGDVWKKLMRDQFLKPYSLADKDSFVAPSPAEVQRIKKANPQLANFTFLTPLPGRPKEFVIGAAILEPAGSGNAHRDAASFQMSPSYTGSPHYTNIAHRLYKSADDPRRLSSSIIGGGMVQTFAFGGKAPPHEEGGMTKVPSPAQPFTLADMMAIATYADFLPKEQMFGWTPTYKYWPVGKGSQPEKTYLIGDGGFIEDTGLLPMLQRRAKKVGLFIFAGPGQQINNTVDFCDLDRRIKSGRFDPKTFKPSGMLADSIYVMFGYGYDDGKWHKSHNTVFEQKEMFPLACRFQKLKKSGKPLVLKAVHEVQQNSYWGIQGGYSVEIVYFYNDRVPEFEALLPKETQQEVNAGSLKGFPTDIPAGLYMKPRVVKLMAAQAEYTVLQNANLFRELFK